MLSAVLLSFALILGYRDVCLRTYLYVHMSNSIFTCTVCIVDVGHGDFIFPHTDRTHIVITADMAFMLLTYVHGATLGHLY